jgi:hypothetical protein
LRAAARWRAGNATAVRGCRSRWTSGAHGRAVQLAAILLTGRRRPTRAVRLRDRAVRTAMAGVEVRDLVQRAADRPGHGAIWRLRAGRSRRDAAIRRGRRAGGTAALAVHQSLVRRAALQRNRLTIWLAALRRRGWSALVCRVGDPAIGAKLLARAIGAILHSRCAARRRLAIGCAAIVRIGAVIPTDRTIGGIGPLRQPNASQRRIVGEPA